MLKQYESKWLNNILPPGVVTLPQSKKQFKQKSKSPILLEQKDLYYLKLTRQVVCFKTNLGIFSNQIVKSHVSRLPIARSPIKLNIVNITVRMGVSKEVILRYSVTEKYIHNSCKSNKDFRIRSYCMKVEDLKKKDSRLQKKI